MGIIAQNCACDSATMEIKASKFIEMISFIKIILFIVYVCVCVCEKDLMS